MRVLITNTYISTNSGSELYVRDIALELLRRGHTPIIYSPRLGKLAQTIRRATIVVIDDLSLLSEPPDIIHGQHHVETMTALLHFPATPCVFFCHGWLPWEEGAPRHPRITNYVAVSDLIREHMMYERGISSDQITVIPNFVDLARFKPRDPLPEKPHRLLVFSNQATESNLIRFVREACAPLGIQVDARGIGSGNPVEHPETILGEYDLVIARGRAAMEAMAVGASVICCDAEGFAGLVTMQNVEWFKRNNFGLRVLNQTVTIDALTTAILQYNPHDAAAVSHYIRTHADITHAVDQILHVYQKTLTQSSSHGAVPPAVESAAVAAYLSWLSRTVYDKGMYEIPALIERIELLTGERSTLEAHNRQLIANSQTPPPQTPQSVATLILKKVYHILIPLSLRLRLRDLRQKITRR